MKMTPLEAKQILEAQRPLANNKEVICALTMGIEALDKEIEQKVTVDGGWIVCPKCKNKLNNLHGHCVKCGQKITN